MNENTLSSNHEVNASNEATDSKKMKNPDLEQNKQNIVLPQKVKKKRGIAIAIITIVSIIILFTLTIIPFIKRYQAISEAFSREKSSLGSIPYDTLIKQEDINSGVMTIQLDQDIVFDYICEVHPFGLDSGYGPSCSYRLSDGSHSIGEYIFNKNYKTIVNLSAKYQDALKLDSSGNIKVEDSIKIREFFLDLIQIDDYNKAYEAFLSIENNYQFRTQFDSIRLKGNIISEGESYGGMDLFDWAIREQLLPR